MARENRLPFRVIDHDGHLVGAAYHAEDAAALAGLHAGSTIRFQRQIVWREGAEHDGLAGESYDQAAGVIYARVDELTRHRRGTYSVTVQHEGGT